MFALFFFVMADITEMHQTAMQDVWIPKSMSDKNVPPRISSFAAAHEPALLYAELLRKYTLGELMASAVSSVGPQWYENKEKAISGYFCQHDNFISFVVGSKNLIDNQTEFQRILDSFKAKHQKTDWDLRAPVITEAQKYALQTVFDKNKSEKNLLKLVCEEAERQNLGIAPYTTKCSILYDGILEAVPQVYRYHPLMDSRKQDIFRRSFTTSSGVFIDCEFETILGEDPPILYRPHAYLGSKITAQEYASTGSRKIWQVSADIWFANGPVLHILDQSAHIHNKAPDAVASPDNMQIGTFSDLLKKGPFISQMTTPYNVTTLHILFDTMAHLPDTTEKLLAYFSQLPLDQQKFIIKQLFPFLRV